MALAREFNWKRAVTVIFKYFFLGDIILFCGSKFTGVGYKELVANAICGESGYSDVTGRTNIYDYHCSIFICRSNIGRILVG